MWPVVLGQAPRSQRKARPDASMSLINDLFQHPIDEGYAEAAARRAAAGEPASSGSLPAKSPALMVGLLLIGLLFTIAAINVQRDAGVVSAEKTSLIEQVNQAIGRSTELEDAVSDVADDILKIETRAGQNMAEGEELRQLMTAAQAAVGTAPVTGPGIVVTVENATNGGEFDECDPSLQVVLDYDLQQVLNGLWAVGAEAVSINDERVTPLTAMRSVNDVILVNIRPIAPPYVISAIGDPQRLAGDFLNGPGGAYLQQIYQSCGIPFTIDNRESLRLPRGAAALQVAQQP
jgi:uncharacterized protein YlxW (UPF0749 family)